MRVLESPRRAEFIKVVEDLDVLDHPRQEDLGHVEQRNFFEQALDREQGDEEATGAD